MEILTVDLTRVRKALLADNSYPEVRHLTQQVEAAFSATRDLKDAAMCLEEFATHIGIHGKTGETVSQAMVRRSLMNNAIVLYCRAVHTSPIERVLCVVPPNRLSPAQQKMHGRIVDLRNTFLAHHGSAPTDPAGPWSEECVHLQFHDDQSIVTHYDIRRRNYNGAAAGELGELIAISLKVIEERSKPVRDKLSVIVDDLRIKDPKFAKIIAIHPWNHDEFYRRAELEAEGGHYAVP